MIKFFKKNWIIIFILVLAAFLRLYRIGGYMEFLGDQGRDVIIIRDFLKNGNLFFIGPQTSIGNMYLGPFYYYFIAPSLLLSNFNPIGPAIFIALLGVLTVWLVFYVSSKWFDQRVGFVSAFLFAISPVVIKYSDFSWNPNIMPLFALLLVYFVVEAILEEKYKYFIFASLSFVMVINSHYLGLILLPVVGLFWLINLISLIRKKDKKIKQFLLNTFYAFLIFLVSLTPQVLFDIKHNGQNIKALLSFFQYRETTVSVKPYKAIPQMLPIFTQITSNLITGQDKSMIVNNLTCIIFLLILLAIAFLNFKKIKETKSKYFLIIFVWLIFGLVGLGLYKQHLYNHYFGFLFPVIYLLMGYVLSLLFGLKKIGKILFIFIFAILTLFSFKSNPFLQKPNNQLVHAKNIAQSIYQHLNNTDGKYNIAMLASYNDFRALAPRYFLLNDFPSDKLLDMEKYSEADTLFVILDDPSKWTKGIDSDIWEINTFSRNKKIIEKFKTVDGTEIVKIIKDKNEKK